jgi:hypothetical protein
MHCYGIDRLAAGSIKQPGSFAGSDHRTSFQAMRSYENESIAVQREVKAVAIGGGVEVNL